MKWVVFLSNPYEFSLEDLKYSLKLNPFLADNVVLFPSRRKVRIYGEGGYEEYEIRNIVKLGEDEYYVVGRLLTEKKADYTSPIKNFAGVEA